MSASARQLRQRIAVQARHRCGYCLTLEVVSGIPLTLEHIIPKSRGGQDTEDNLWLSCRLCNEPRLQHCRLTVNYGYALLFSPFILTWFWLVRHLYRFSKTKTRASVLPVP